MTELSEIEKGDIHEMPCGCIARKIRNWTVIKDRPCKDFIEYREYLLRAIDNQSKLTLADLALLTETHAKQVYDEWEK